jgi:hypothetical protein
MEYLFEQFQKKVQCAFINHIKKVVDSSDQLSHLQAQKPYGVVRFVTCWAGDVLATTFLSGFDCGDDDSSLRYKCINDICMEMVHKFYDVPALYKIYSLRNTLEKRNDAQHLVVFDRSMVIRELDKWLNELGIGDTKEEIPKRKENKK